MLDHAPQGVLALGDSITNGGGELQWGIALQSWAQWLSRGLGVPLTNHAIDGATVADVLQREIPVHEQRSARPRARFDVGCLYIGVNDVRAPGWDAGAYAFGVRAALAWLTARCDRTLVCTLPLGLGRPRVGREIAVVNAILAAAAGEHGALLVDLRDFGARNHVMVDRVHPTAFGQITLAERALDVLSADGVTVRVRPHTLISYDTSAIARLRGDGTLVYRHAKAGVRGVLLRRP